MLAFDDIRLALSQAPWFISIMSRDGKCVYSSAYAYGYQAADLEGVSSDTSIHPEDRPLWWAALWRARDRREVVPYSVRIVIPEAPGVIRLAGRLYPVIDRDNSTVRYIGCIAEDVTHGPILPPAIPASAPLAAPLATPLATPLAPLAPLEALPPRPPFVPPGARWLAPMGEAIAAFLASRPGWQAAEAIAAGIGEQPTNRFRSMLTSLAERGILEASSGHGYRLAGYGSGG